MIEIDTSRYVRVTRSKALNILERAELKPDRFIAHRNRTFTAKYLRDRQPLFAGLRYEEQIEIAADRGAAIFKRPNTRIDRGRYITLKFAVAPPESVGIPRAPAPDSAAPKTKPASAPPKTKEDIKATLTATVEAVKPAPRPAESDALTRLIGVVQEIKQLAQYAHESYAREVAEKEDKQHILVTLDELKKHVETLSAGLHELDEQRRAKQ